jgi:hypothetical protein
MPGASLLILCLSACLYLTGARIVPGIHIEIIFYLETVLVFLSACLYLTGARIVETRLVQELYQVYT